MTASPEDRPGIKLILPGDKLEEEGLFLVGPYKPVVDAMLARLTLTQHNLGEQQVLALDPGCMSSGKANEWTKRGYYQLGVSLKGISGSVFESALCFLRLPHTDFDIVSEMVVDPSSQTDTNGRYEEVISTRLWELRSADRQVKTFPLTFVKPDVSFLSTFPFAFQLRQRLPYDLYHSKEDLNY